MPVSRYRFWLLGGWIILVVSAGLVGCVSSRPPLNAQDVAQRYRALRDRIVLRQDSTHTASFRLRWRVREVEPHSDIILRIDYRAPILYHIVGKGPMDVPVFTGWVADSNYALILHREHETIYGHLRDLDPEDFTLDIRPFGGFLRLFAGRISGLLPTALTKEQLLRARQDPGEFVVRDDVGRSIELDLTRQRLESIVWRNDTPGNRWVFAVEYGSHSDSYPYWRLKEARWENLDGPGRYDWDILAEKYNPELPERLFLPPEFR